MLTCAWSLHDCRGNTFRAEVIYFLFESLFMSVMEEYGIQGTVAEVTANPPDIATFGLGCNQADKSDFLVMVAGNSVDSGTFQNRTFFISNNVRRFLTSTLSFKFVLRNQHQNASAEVWCSVPTHPARIDRSDVRYVAISDITCDYP